MRALLIVLAVAVLSLSMGPHQAVAETLKVGCQTGLPPFSDAKDEDPLATECVGLFAEVFYTIQERLGFDYNMTMVSDDHLEPLLYPPANFDMIVSPHVITHNRLSGNGTPAVNFTIAIYQSEYRFALPPSYHRPAGSLRDAVLRSSVYYLTGVTSVLMLGFAVMVLILEHMSESSMIHDVPYWMRPLWALEMGFETLITSTTPVDLGNQLSKSVRVVFAFMGLFVVNILAAVITAQLTVSATGSDSISVSDLKGLKIGHTSETAATYLRANGIIPIDVSTSFGMNLETFAEGFYQGQQPAVDGFFGPAEVIVFLHNNRGGTDNGYTISDAMKPSGTKDLNAIVLSRDSNATLLDEINVEAEKMRRDGELSLLTTKYLQPLKTEGSGDFPVPQKAYDGMRIFCFVFFAVTVVGCIGGGIYDKVKSNSVAPVKAVPPTAEEPSSATQELQVSPAAPILRMNGEVFNVNREFECVLDSLAKTYGTTRPS